jgi:hypothetical protein
MACFKQLAEAAFLQLARDVSGTAHIRVRRMAARNLAQLYVKEYRQMDVIKLMKRFVFA